MIILLLLNSLFYSFCLVGMIWQILQVSTNFFEYLVVLDTQFVPTSRDTALNMCFKISGVTNQSRYLEVIRRRRIKSTYATDPKYRMQLLGRYFSRDDLIYITYNQGNLLLNDDNQSSFDGNKFGFGLYICFQLYESTDFVETFITDTAPVLHRFKKPQINPHYLIAISDIL